MPDSPRSLATDLEQIVPSAGSRSGASPYQRRSRGRGRRRLRGRVVPLLTAYRLPLPTPADKNKAARRITPEHQPVSQTTPPPGLLIR
jgi:hypothetical protein